MKMKKIFATMAATAVSAASFAAMAIPSASAAGDVKGNAFFIGNLGGETVWHLEEVNADSTTAAVDGDAQYEVEWVPQNGGTDTVQFLAVCIAPADGVDNFGTSTFPELEVTLDEVWIDGQKLDYTPSADAVTTSYFEGGAGVTRIYLHDEWAGTNVADLPGDTTITESVKVRFTVSGLGVEGTSNVTEDPDPTEPPTDEPTDPVVTTTTAAADGGDTTTTTTAKDGDTTTTTAKGNGSSGTTTTAKKGGSNGTTTTAKAASNGGKSETSAATGDAGVGVAAAALVLAGTAAIAVRKRK